MFFSDRSKAVLLLWIIFVFIFHDCLCYAVISVLCSIVITCWEKADLLALSCAVFSCVFVTFLSGVVRDCIDS